MLMRLRAVVVSCLLVLTAIPVLGQGSISAQVLRLLDRANTWTATQTFASIIVTGTCSGCGTSPATTVICSGSANQTAINTAITALPSVGGIVTLSGTCTIGGAITIAKSNVTLQGQGKSTKIIPANGSGPYIILTLGDAVSAYSNIQVKSLWIDGNAANVVGYVGPIVIKNLVSNYVIEDVTSDNTHAINIEDDNSGDAFGVIRQNILELTGGTTNDNVFGVAGGTRVEQNRFTSDAFCIETGGGGVAPVIIAHNYFVQTGGTRDCLTLDRVANVSNNYFQDMRGAGIVSSIGPSTMTGNSFYITNNPTGALINVNAGSIFAITGNSFEVYTGNTAAVTGIRAGIGGSITGNTMKFWTSFNHIGINASSSLLEIVMAGNQLLNTGAGSPVGITVAGSNDCVITGNSIVGFTTGVVATTTEDCTISGNNFQNNGVGVNFNQSQFIAITGNTFENGGVTSAGGGTTVSPLLVSNTLSLGSTAVLTGATNLTRYDLESANIPSLTSTGSAGSKNVVCVDTTTGKLYASTTGTDCSS